MDILNFVSLRFLGHLLSTPRGRAHLLSQMADAETNDEGRVFERARARTDDQDIARLVVRHEQDELRHSLLLWQCVDRQGMGRAKIPEYLKIINPLDAALGGLMNGPIEGREDIMRLYLLLQVIEERALTQFALFEPVFRRVDPQTADVIVAIIHDEERHLKYCHAITRRYATTPEVMAKTLARYRCVEARVFAENARANMNYIMEHDLLNMGAFGRWVWLTLARFSPREQRTPYWGQAPVSSTVDPRVLSQAACAQPREDP